MQQQYTKTIFWPVFPIFWHVGRKYAQGPIVNGRRHGQWRFWYRSGQPQMAGVYENGRKVGRWTKFWPNNKPMSQGMFADGKMDGLWQDWYENGTLAQESNWDKGRKSGKLTAFNPDGSIIKTEVFDPEKEMPADYTLMTDRDMAEAIRCARKSQMARTWTRMVGPKIARHVEPWHIALWILVMIPAYSRFAPQMDILAVPVSAVFSSLVSTGVVGLTYLHEVMTSPGFGAREIPGSD